MVYYPAIGRRIYHARQKRQMSALDLSRRSRINIKQISHYETGTRQPGIKNIRRLAHALNVSADYLLGLE